MTGVNILRSPNRLHIGPNPVVTYYFGGVPIVAANPLCAHPNIRIRSDHIVFEFAPCFASELSLRLPIEIARLGLIPDGLNDAVAVTE